MLITSCSNLPNVICLCTADDPGSSLETYRNNPVSHSKGPFFGGRASGQHGGSIHSILQTDAAVCKPQEVTGWPPASLPSPGHPTSSLLPSSYKRGCQQAAPSLPLHPAPGPTNWGLSYICPYICPGKSNTQKARLRAQTTSCQESTWATFKWHRPLIPVNEVL